MQKKAIVFDVDGVIFINGVLNSDVLEFIKEQSSKYLFFTNTTFSKRKLVEIFTKHWLEKYFMQLLAYEDGNKNENIQYILEIYGISSDNMLFIDDLDSNINMVKDIWIHTLLFSKDRVSLAREIVEKTNFKL